MRDLVGFAWFTLLAGCSPGPNEPAPSATARGAAPASVPSAAPAAAAPASPTATRRTTTPRTLALLVGIDDYAPPTDGRWPSLRGAQRDVASVAELLRTRFHFDAADIVTLTGKQATHAAIVKTFHDHLVARAEPDTRVVFWFSGHGSQIEDPSGRDRAEADDYAAPHDQTMIAWDSRADDRRGKFDFSDDELHLLLSALRSRDVVVVTDCCHSGGVTRDGARPGGDGCRSLDDGTQPLDWALVQPFWPQGWPLRTDDRDDADPPHVVHVAACSSKEEAGEIETPEGHHGTLTWFLLGVLAEAPADTSWRAVGETVRARVAGFGTRPGQVVQVHGDAERAIFGGAGRPVPAGFGVQRVNDREVAVAAGRIHGVGGGSKLRLVGADNRTVAEATVQRARPSNCTATLDRGELPRGSALWAVPAGGLAGRMPLRVLLGAGVAADLLADCPWASIAATEADYQLVAAGRRLELQQLDGRFVRAAENEREAVLTALLREHCFRALWEGIVQPGTHAIEVGVATPTPDQCTVNGVRCEPASLVPVAKAPRATVAAPWLRQDSGGGLVMVTITNKSDEGLFVALLSVQEDRAVNLIRGKDASNCFLQPGATMSCRVLVGPSEVWRGDRPMIDRYVAIATPRWADFRPFVSDAPIETTRGPGEQELPGFLQAALSGSATRGDEKNTWGIAWFDLELLPPATK